MLKKVNLIDEVNGIENLYVYKKIAKLNEHILNVVRVENRTLDFHITNILTNYSMLLKVNLNWKQTMV